MLAFNGSEMREEQFESPFDVVSLYEVPSGLPDARGG